MAIRDRVKELRRVKASDLLANPENWRTHPYEQQNAIRGILNEVGFAGALLAREQEDGSLILIDGHLRADTASDEEIPVLVLDVDAEEARKILLTFDPIAAMAGANSAKLDALLAENKIQDDSLVAMLQDVAAIYNCDWAKAYTEEGDTDPNGEWTGMPTFGSENQEPLRSIKVNFYDLEEVKKFADLIGQNISDKTRFVSFPEQPQRVVSNLSFEAEQQQ